MKELKRNLRDLEQIHSSHNGINKFVFFKADECASSITQIAYSFLKRNDIVEQHSHPTMEEVFLILEGECIFVVEENEVALSSLDVIKIPPGSLHQIYANTDCKFYYFGVSV